MNIAIVGFGNHAASKIVPAILENDYNIIAVVSSSNSNKVINLANRSVPVLKDLSSLKSLNLDCIYISTPISTHYKLAKESLELGFNVICEKPLSTNFKHSNELFNIASKQKLFLFEVNMHMHHHQYRFLESIYYSPKKYRYLGTKQKVILSFCIPHLDANDFRYDPALGGGAIYDVGYYPVSTMLSLNEDLREIFIFKQAYIGPKGEINKLGNAFFEDSNSLVFEVRWSIGQNYENFCHVIFENGDIYFDRFFSKPINFDAKTIITTQKKTFKKKSHENHFESMLKKFRDIIFEKKESNLVEYELLKKRTLNTAKFFDRYV